MERGKLSLRDIKNLLKQNKDIMLDSNILGSDFSFLERDHLNLVFKIEPMVFYKFLSVRENAILSTIFPLNDFITSGTWPSLAMIDFEKPEGAAKDFYRYINNIFELLRERGMKVASGHTGSYGNIGYGVAGSMALLGLRKPVFSFGRITKEDSFYSVGLLGEELAYFTDRQLEGKANRVADLSIERYVLEFLKIRKIVHYVHDNSEGGLFRALGEVSELAGIGFDVDSRKLEMVTAEGARKYGLKVFSASSSGSLVVSIDSRGEIEFENMMKSNNWPFFKLKKRKEGITLDCKKFRIPDTMLKILP